MEFIYYHFIILCIIEWLIAYSETVVIVLRTIVTNPAFLWCDSFASNKWQF